MKPLLAGALVCLLGSPLSASCDSAAQRQAAAPAVLGASTSQCRAQVDDAARALLGRTVVLAADAFRRSDAVVLSTLGQSASGRMLAPTDILRLELGANGCQLRLQGRDRTLALPRCACRAAAGG